MDKNKSLAGSNQDTPIQVSEPQRVYQIFDQEIRSRPDIFKLYPEEAEQLRTRKPTEQKVEIPGLTILHNFLSDQEHDELAEMAMQEQDNAGSDGTESAYNHLMSTSPFIPTIGLYYYLKRIVDRLISQKRVVHMPAQLTINYYEPTQGLRSHTDNIQVIKEWIVGISLLSSCVMTFTSTKDGQVLQYPLFPGSVMIQSGEARYLWRHGIEPTQIQKAGGYTIKREFRISLQLSDFDLNYFLHPDVSKLKVKGEQK